MIESKLTDEAREKLREMIAAGEVKIGFTGHNPDTKAVTRFIEVKAKRKLFSKTIWKVIVSYGDGSRSFLALQGDNAEIEERIWEIMKVIDSDFQHEQRRDEMGLS